MALCPDVASLTVNQFDCCNLLWRSVVCYETGKTSYWPLLKMPDLSRRRGAFCPVHTEHRHCRTTRGGLGSDLYGTAFCRSGRITRALSYVLAPMLWHWREG